MSDIPAELNIRDVLGRIDRQREETQKFIAEERKLTQEARKLDAEHDKLRRDRNLAPWLIAASFLGSGAAGIVGQIIQHFWK
jgi:hypothetical protein